MKQAVLVLLFVLLGNQVLAWSEEAVSPAAPATPELNLILQWSPQSQFAGYYLAESQGFFARRGLQVRIQKGGPDVDSIKLLAEGKAHFTTMFLTGAIAARDRGIPLVLCGQMVNRSHLMIVGWRNQGIQRLEDLDGQKISIWEGNFRGAFVGLFQALGIHPIIFPQNYTVNLFLRKGVAGCSAMEYNEYHMIYQAGVDLEEISSFLLREHGFDIPEDGIYCMEDFYRGNREKCRAFVEACLEGWRYAQEHPEEALDVVMQKVRESHLPTNRAHMKWMLEKILPGILPAQGSSWTAGQLSETGYRRALEAMKQQIDLSKALPLSRFCGDEGSHAE